MRFAKIGNNVINLAQVTHFKVDTDEDEWNKEENRPYNAVYAYFSFGIGESGYSDGSGMMSYQHKIKVVGKLEDEDKALNIIKDICSGNYDIETAPQHMQVGTSPYLDEAGETIIAVDQRR